MKVRMLSTQRGSEDGITLAVHEAGGVYDLAERLAGIYLRAGMCEPADSPAAAPEPAPAAPVAPEPVVVKPKKTTAQKTPQRRKAKKS